MDLSRFFARSDEVLFLNAGSLTRTPLAALRFAETSRQEAELNPTKAFFLSYSRLWELQTKVGAYLGTNPAHLMLRSSITEALCDFCFSVPLDPGGEVLVTDWEYGATSEIARERARQDGRRFRSVGFRSDDASGEAILAALKPETRLLVFSHVITGTGAVLPVAKIAKAAKANGTVVVVDGAHAPGALALELDSYVDVDFYGGNLHKWFLGPRGTGFGWVNPQWDGKIDWKFSGWAGRDTPAFYQGFGGASREAARRLSSGTFDPAPFYGLEKVLEFWEEHGAERIRARQAALRDRCAQRAEALGWERMSPRDPTVLGPLVSYQLPNYLDGSDTLALTTRIYLETGVQLALPKTAAGVLVRFSPGCYSTEHEIDLAFERLEKFR
jgi:isopenicillin-N epimerase